MITTFLFFDPASYVAKPDDLFIGDPGKPVATPILRPGPTRIGAWLPAALPGEWACTYALRVRKALNEGPPSRIIFARESTPNDLTAAAVLTLHSDEIDSEVQIRVKGLTERTDDALWRIAECALSLDARVALFRAWLLHGRLDLRVFDRCAPDGEEPRPRAALGLTPELLAKAAGGSMPGGPPADLDVLPLLNRLASAERDAEVARLCAVGSMEALRALPVENRLEALERWLSRNGMEIVFDAPGHCEVADLDADEAS